MYSAYITTIKGLRKHSNADRLQCVSIFGNNVIVDLSYKEGQRVIFFPTDGQLSEDFATRNNLVRKKDDTGNSVGGYLDPDKRNITALKLRGEKSEGLVLPIEVLGVYTNISNLKDGDQITVLNGHEICRKYIPKADKPSNKHNSSNGNKKRNAVKPINNANNLYPALAIIFSLLKNRVIIISKRLLVRIAIKTVENEYCNI